VAALSNRAGHGSQNKMQCGFKLLAEVVGTWLSRVRAEPRAGGAVGIGLGLEAGWRHTGWGGGGPSYRRATVCMNRSITKGRVLHSLFLSLPLLPPSLSLYHLSSLPFQLPPVLRFLPDSEFPGDVSGPPSSPLLFLSFPLLLPPPTTSLHPLFLFPSPSLSLSLKIDSCLFPAQEGSVPAKIYSYGSVRVCVCACVCDCKCAREHKDLFRIFRFFRRWLAMS